MQPEISKLNDAEKAFHWIPVFQLPELLPWRPFNWRNFEALCLGFEYGIHTGRYLEIRAVFLGVGFQITIIDRLERSVFMAKMDQIKAECFDGLSEHQDEGGDA